MANFPRLWIGDKSRESKRDKSFSKLKNNNRLLYFVEAQQRGCSRELQLIVNIAKEKKD